MNWSLKKTNTLIEYVRKIVVLKIKIDFSTKQIVSNQKI